VEWLKVKALSSSPRTAKIKQPDTESGNSGYNSTEMSKGELMRAKPSWGQGKEKKGAGEKDIKGSWCST
jgi:hypothetical protein